MSEFETSPESEASSPFDAAPDVGPTLSPDSAIATPLGAGGAGAAGAGAATAAYGHYADDLVLDGLDGLGGFWDSSPGASDELVLDGLDGLGGGWDPSQEVIAGSMFPLIEANSSAPHIYREGELRTSSQEFQDSKDFDAELLIDSADPTNEHEMQKLIDGVGGSANAGQMGPHEKLKFLADNGMAPELIPPRHRELMKTDIPDAAKESLMELDQDVHNPYDLGHGNYNVDEYSVILDKLPDGMTPQDFLNSFLRSPNGATDSSKFDLLNEFNAKRAGSDEPWASELDMPDLGPGLDGEPGIDGPPLDWAPGFDPNAPDEGDWYNIEIPANDGDVMIVDKDTDMRDHKASATVQTMTDDGPMFAKDHPVSGRRQFGIEELPDGGGYRFYTRGLDRSTNSTMDNDISRDIQHQDWSAMMAGMAKQHGGRSEHVDEFGQPVWGWHEHHSAEALLKSGVKPARPSGDAPMELDLPPQTSP